jgi:hypothetical protein
LFAGESKSTATLCVERGGAKLVRKAMGVFARGPVADDGQANDNPQPHPFNAKAWRRKYMKAYMRRWRALAKQQREGKEETK